VKLAEGLLLRRMSLEVALRDISRRRASLIDNEAKQT
jgi:hypothetical protein